MLLSAMPPVDDDMHVAHIGHNAVLLIQLPKPAATFPSAICEIRNSSLNYNRGRARGVFLSQLLPVYPRSPDSASCRRRLVLNRDPSKSDTLVFPPKTSPPRQLIGHASSNGLAHLPQEAHTRTYTHAHAHLNRSHGTESQSSQSDPPLSPLLSEPSWSRAAWLSDGTASHRLGRKHPWQWHQPSRSPIGNPARGSGGSRPRP